jgi:uncharacterized protein YxeA
MNLSILRAALATLVLAVSGPARAEDAAVTAKLAKIPAPAAEALKKAAGSAKIDGVTIEKDGKTTIYEASLTEAGKPNREVSVTADGKLNAEEETVPLDKVPEIVRKAIEAGAKGAKVERVQHIKRASGGETFEAQYAAKGKKTEVEYTADGKVKPEAK